MVYMAIQPTYPTSLFVFDKVAEVLEILKLFVYHKSFSISNKVVFTCLDKFESFSFMSLE